MTAPSPQNALLLKKEHKKIIIRIRYNAFTTTYKASFKPKINVFAGMVDFPLK
jgi:hypothetical protein